MPLIAHYDLPSFTRLKNEGEIVLSKDRAEHQEIRELHIGLLNMMPDAALEATERQFFRLVGRSNQIAQFYLHPFSLPSITRSAKTTVHIGKYYKTFEQIKAQGLDALIITGANVSTQDLAQAEFFPQLSEVVNWAYENVTSTLCSCLATHAAVEILFEEKRTHMGEKYWGVFEHIVLDRTHPLVHDIDTKFNVPHSRYNQISKQQFESFNGRILVANDFGVHLATSPDGFRMVFFQGHPEYDTISLLKEYKREIIRFLAGERDYPVLPENYLNLQAQAILQEFKQNLIAKTMDISDFPEQLIAKDLHNTWAAVSGVIMNNWIGLVYQTTNADIKKPFMDGLDKNNPLGLLK
jgi:homoserine O-succinyltransferase